MNAEIKKQWVTALRSDKYEQGRGFLRKIDCFCAQGVLCDLYAQANNIDWKMKFGTSGRYSIVGMWDLIPNEVEKWAGLQEITNRMAKLQDKVVQMNDFHGYSFYEIADYIEQNL